jgi:hypothetical protein
MKKGELKTGMSVRIRQWDDMAKEFGMSGSEILVPCRFTEYMRHLCRKTGIFSGSLRNGTLCLEGIDLKSSINEYFYISAEMLEHAVVENCR